MVADTTSGSTQPMEKTLPSLGMELKRCHQALSNLSIRDLGFSPGLSSMKIQYARGSLLVMNLIYSGMARKVTVVVESGKGGFSCFMTKDSDDLKFCLIGDGKTVKAAMEDFLVADKEMRESFAEDGMEYPDLEFHFVLDVGAFFNYYPLSITAFAKYIGMNASLLRQYAAGIKSPQGKSLEKIRQGVEKLRENIDTGLLIDKPVLQYV